MSTDFFATYNEPASLERQGKDTTPAVVPTEPIGPTHLTHQDLLDNAPSPGHAEGTTAESIGNSEAHILTAIDEEEDIWEVEALLARWKQGRRAVYLVKWKGFPHEANTWQKRTDINAELVDDFDAVYAEQGGNHEGVELLDKRVRQGKVEYLVGWKGLPGTQNSWEKGSTISQKRINDFEACNGN
ncbi:hypothetical protein F4803DRAFT_515045 [Xylaria telfairii]|nr:hypothetical protein F4803DRAFT_515045 [Xylaria telfairii]